jgi:hypothetical protein
VVTTDDRACSNCRFHSIKYKPVAVGHVEVAGGPLPIFEGEEKVFTCKAEPRRTVYGGKEVGPEPVFCTAWEALRILSEDQRAELDRLMNLSAARAKGRKDDER